VKVVSGYLGRGLSLIMAESRHQLCLYQVRAVKNDKNDKLDIFKYQGMEVRILKDEQGNPWWVAKDVCAILGLGNSREAVARFHSAFVAASV
jgi:hypothetical protein